MIKVTRLNKIDCFWINDESIEFIEQTPDTMISFESGKKMNVAESVDEVIRLIDERRINLLRKSRF